MVTISRNSLCIASIIHQLNYGPIIALSQIASAWKEYYIANLNVFLPTVINAETFRFKFFA